VKNYNGRGNGANGDELLMFYYGIRVIKTIKVRPYPITSGFVVVCDPCAPSLMRER